MRGTMRAARVVCALEPADRRPPVRPASRPSDMRPRSEPLPMPCRARLTPVASRGDVGVPCVLKIHPTLHSSSCGSSASPMLARCRSYPRKLGDGPQHTRGVPSRQQSGSQTRTRVCATAHALAHKNDHIYILRLRRLVSSRAAENCAGGVGQQPRTCVPRLTLSPMYIAPSPPREQRRRTATAAWGSSLARVCPSSSGCVDLQSG